MEKSIWQELTEKRVQRIRRRVWQFDDEFRRRFYNHNDTICDGVKLLWEHVKETAMSDDPQKVDDAAEMLAVLFDHRDMSHDAWWSEYWPNDEVKGEDDMTPDELEEANMTLEELYL